MWEFTISPFIMLECRLFFKVQIVKPCLVENYCSASLQFLIFVFRIRHKAGHQAIGGCHLEPHLHGPASLLQ